MVRRRLSSLRVRLLFLVALALIPAFGLIVYSASEQKKAAAAGAKEEALKRARQAVQLQRQSVSRTRQILAQIAQHSAVDISKPEACSEFLAGHLTQHPHDGYINFGVIDLNGALKCSALPFKGPINLSDRAYFQRTLETRNFSPGGYQIGRVTGKASINFGYPNFDRNDKFQSVVFASLDLSSLNQVLTQGPISPGSVLTIIDQEGLILSRSAEPEKWIGKTMEQSPLIRAILDRGGEGTVESPGVDGVNRLYAFSPLTVSGQNAVYVALGISTNEAYANVRWTTVRNLLLLGVVGGFVFVIAWVGADLFVLRQVATLVNVTKQLAIGQLSARTGLRRGRGELSELAHSIDEMAESLETTRNQLNRVNRALRTIGKFNELAARANDETVLLKETCQIIVELGAYHSAWIGYADQHDAKNVSLLALAGYGQGYLETLRLSGADAIEGLDTAHAALRTGKASVTKKLQSEPTNESAGNGSPAHTYASSIALPLIRDGKAVGALTIHAREIHAFDSKEEKLLTELAANLSYSITMLRTKTAHRDSETRFQSLVSAVQDYAIIMLDPEGVVASWNMGAERITGYQADEIIGQHFSRFFDSEAMQAGEPDQELRAAETQGRIEKEGWRLHKNGARFWASIIMTPIRDDAGNLKGFSKVTRDLTERKQAEDEILRLNKELEQRVIQRTEQLEAANKELEAFSYSVSHDLRAPLRSIDGFSQALLEDYEDKLDKEGKDYLNRVRASAQRMAELIDDLLKLSRVSRAEMHSEMIDINAMARHIAAELQRSQPERQVEFVIADDMVARGDSGLLKAALENLIGNAWKFTAKRQIAKIEVGITGNNGSQTYYVRDNGAGFDMTYASKLFGAFQRLHTDAEFRGTGIGLATVQRIVHRHGGQVWAESAVDKGAAFYFTLSS